MKKIMIVLLTITALASCKKDNPLKDTTYEYEYKYEVSGTGGNYSITIQNANNNTQKWFGEYNGWWYKWNQDVTVYSTGEPVNTRLLYLSAQNNNSSGNVTVKIYRNNIVVAQNTSYGGFTIATVSGDY